MITTLIIFTLLVAVIYNHRRFLSAKFYRTLDDYDIHPKFFAHIISIVLLHIVGFLIKWIFIIGGLILLIKWIK